MMRENPLHSFRYCPKCGSEGFEDHAGRAKRCSQCGLTYFHNVASAVACFVRDPQGRFLFVRRAHDPARGTLDLPGGFVDPMETVEQAVARELLEETGLRIHSDQARYLTSRPNLYPYSGVDIYTSDLVFLVEVPSLEGAIAADDAAELVIAPLDALRAEDFGLQSIRGIMAEALRRGQAFSALYE